MGQWVGVDHASQIHIYQYFTTADHKNYRMHRNLKYIT